MVIRSRDKPTGTRVCQWLFGRFVCGFLGGLPVVFWVVCQWFSGWFACGFLGGLPVSFWMVCLWFSGWFHWFVGGLLDGLSVVFWVVCLWFSEWFVCGFLGGLSVVCWVVCLRFLWVVYQWFSGWLVCGFLGGLSVVFWVVCLWFSGWLSVANLKLVWMGLKEKVSKFLHYSGFNEKKSNPQVQCCRAGPFLAGVPACKIPPARAPNLGSILFCSLASKAWLRAVKIKLNWRKNPAPSGFGSARLVKLFFLVFLLWTYTEYCKGFVICTCREVCGSICKVLQYEEEGKTERSGKEK